MDHTTRYSLGEAAQLRRTCQLLISELEKFDSSLSGAEYLAPPQEAAVSNANRNLAGAAREHLDLAIQYVNDWVAAIGSALQMGEF